MSSPTIKRPRIVACVLALSLGAGMLTTGSAQAQVSVAIKQVVLGNIFTEGATPHFEVQTPADAVNWSVRDYWGHEAGLGREPVSGGRVRLSLPVGAADARPDYHYWLAREVYQAVKAVRPDVTVTTPQLSAGEQNTATWLPWLEEFFRLGGLNYLDVVSLHPYRLGRDGPEGMPGDIATVRELMREYGHGDKPIWITEMGWRTNLALVSEQVQAARLPRAYVLAFAAGVERFSWYNFMDHASGPFGLIRAPGNPVGGYSPKPSYVAYAVMTSQLAGLPYRDRDRAPDGVHSYRFGAGPDSVRVMWSPDADTTVSLMTDKPLRVTDVMGATRTLTPVRGRVSLTLTGDPLYVRGDIDAIAERSPFSIQAADSVAGQAVPVTLRLDNATPELRGGPTSATFTVTGHDYTLFAAPGEVTELVITAAPLSMPGHDASCTACGKTGERTIRAEVRVNGSLTGRLAAGLTITRSS